jgi:hypothetical protein
MTCYKNGEFNCKFQMQGLSLNQQIVLSHMSKDIIRINSAFGKFNIFN